MECEEVLSAEQQVDPDLAAPSPLEGERRSPSECIDDVLAALAALAAAVKRTVVVGAPELRQEVSAAVLPARGKTERRGPHKPPPS
ncbi:unnamed protein product [Lampetra fluviatilis]